MIVVYKIFYEKDLLFLHCKNLSYCENRFLKFELTMSNHRSTTSNHFTILYASQSGFSQAIAEKIFRSALNYGFKPSIYSTGLIGKRFLMKDITCVVLIASTYGDGEPPDSAVKFYRRISSNIKLNCGLSHMDYALLALGDSRYGEDKFCEFGKNIDAKLQFHGAHKFYDTGYGDDSGNFYEDVHEWVENLWPVLRKQFGLPELLLPKFPIISKGVKSEEATERAISNLGVSTEPDLQDSFERIQILLAKDVTVKNILSFVKTIEQKNFIMPDLPEPFLNLTFDNHTSDVASQGKVYKFLISADSKIVEAEVTSVKRLTEDEECVNKILELILKFKKENIKYKPGDTFGFLCANSPREVTYLLERLDLLKHADRLCKITLLESPTHQMQMPLHIPPTSTLRDILTYYIDLRSVPSQLFLSVLAHHSTDDLDRLSLGLLSSEEGIAVFRTCIQNPHICILDILEVFQSCSPPVKCLLEHLPYLQPRYYSIASSPLVSKSTFRIVFRMFRIKKNRYRLKSRKGTCSGMFNRKTLRLQTRCTINSEIESGISGEYKPFPNVFVFKKYNHSFYLPQDTSTPIIMVGPGTAVSPFIGFLQHKEQQMLSASENDIFGETWLFYGCRYEKKDFLYKHELERWLNGKVLTHLLTCFSREEKDIFDDSPRYVQESIVQNSKPLMELIDKGAIIYVCGSSRAMVPSVWDAFSEVFKTTKDCSKGQAENYLRSLRSKKRYRVGEWF